ncbi:MAG: sulfotransferase [Bacteroidetes bacterium]|nr:sulfotransferase [Bacteroidota bacterium]
MNQTKSRTLLLLGCQRSGTTLLAAMLGGHSEINMLFESTSGDVLRLIGKKYNGNKLLPWRQIRKKQKASKFGHFMNRLVNLDFSRNGSSHPKIRLFPTSSLSIEDYLKNDARIITITRNREEVVRSITTRTKLSRKQAEKEYDRSMQEMEGLTNMAFQVDFADLVNHPVETLQAICEYLELEFESRMLEGVEYNFVYPHSSVMKDKSTLVPVH